MSNTLKTYFVSRKRDFSNKKKMTEMSERKLKKSSLIITEQDDADTLFGRY